MLYNFKERSDYDLMLITAARELLTNEFQSPATLAKILGKHPSKVGFALRSRLNVEHVEIKSINVEGVPRFLYRRKQVAVAAGLQK